MDERISRLERLVKLLFQESDILLSEDYDALCEQLMTEKEKEERKKRIREYERREMIKYVQAMRKE